jgi:endo-1,4-beta-xylanase
MDDVKTGAAELRLREIEPKKGAFLAQVPKYLRVASPKKGLVQKIPYQCFYYTDSSDMGTEIQKKFEGVGYALERRDAPIQKYCNVYLPYGYEQGGVYPTVYILHGITLNEDAFLLGEDTTNLFDNLISAGLVKPFIAVFPNGNSGAHFMDRSFSNQAGYYFFANELIHDLIPYIESRYSVLRDRGGRSLCGHSMGGMQTINVGLCQCLPYFSGFGVFAAAPTSYSAHQIASYLESGPKEDIRLLYAICGNEDNVALESHCRAFDGLRNETSRLNGANFMNQREPGDHFDGRIVILGLFNFIVNVFGK